MIKIDRVGWGKVFVDNKKFHQVLIANNDVEERQGKKLHQLFGTTHRLGDWEQKKLLTNRPEVVLIANGFNGILKVEKDFSKKVAKAGAELLIDLTPQAVKKYNLLVAAGKRVNALIHTTC